MPQAQKLLQLFPNEGAANPRAAQDLADVYLLKAKVAERSADLAAAQSLLDLALKPLRATALQTPANMASRAMLGQACTWAAQSKLAANFDYKHCAREQREALQTANGLTAWWAAQIKTFSNS